MKTIFIVLDDRPFWNVIIAYLNYVNAENVLMDLRSLSDRMRNKSPDLIISGRSALKEISAIATNIPKLVINEGEIDAWQRKDIHFLSWPIGRETFLDITSRLLYVSERRYFKTIITIAKKGEKETILGNSLNFSSSGIAFKVEKSLNIGDLLTISFFIPIADKRLTFEAEVMRKALDPADGSVYYGVRLLNLTKDMKNILEGFIKKTA